ncbi:hypothetical protein [Streptomyces europaeiscabiei]|uniref:hypothetical protein n=1 Tax=Streptomyces europaeiscabiei TaxID=146819 RepID=UPI002E0DF712|nr:hypothetical protein OHB30_33365 [Streptomyces europaeiscabiei]
MSRAFITVQPAREQRTDFARWATTQDPKVRTVSPQAFGVPHDLFTGMPEHLLVGALVDGHCYVSPDEGHEAADAADGPELLGVDQPEMEGFPGQSLPTIPDEAYPPDAKPLPEPDFAPLADAPDDDSDPSDPGDDTGSQGDEITCDVCDRPFKTERGRDTHRRQVHPEA